MMNDFGLVLAFGIFFLWSHLASQEQFPLVVDGWLFVITPLR